MRVLMMGLVLTIAAGMNESRAGELPNNPQPVQEQQSRGTNAAAGQPANQPTAQPAAAPATFCKDDARPEVQTFCSQLSHLMASVEDAQRNGKSDAEIRKRVELQLEALDPAMEASTGALAQAISAYMLANAVKDASQNILKTASQMTTTQQLGASSSAPGTTSLVTKAAGAAVINLAVDSGVLTRSVNGATTTLNANAEELFNLLTGREEYDLFAQPNAFVQRVFSPLSLTASFALAQSNSTTAPASGSASGTTTTSVSSVSIPTGAGKLTSFSAKYEVLNHYDPRSATFKKKWQSIDVSTLDPLKIATAHAQVDVIEQLESDKQFQDFVMTQGSSDCKSELLEAAEKHDTAKLMNNFETYCWDAEIGHVLKSPPAKLQSATGTYLGNLAKLRQAYREALKDVAGNMFSAQYAFNKPLNQPETHDITLIYTKDFGQYGSLDFNGGFSIYGGTLPAGAKYGRIHFGQASGEYDRNLNPTSNSLQSQLSLAGYWQYQPEPSVLNIPAGTVLPGTTIPIPNGIQEFVGTKGSLWVTQGKVTIKGPDGVNIPLGVSWSNKSDLLQGTKVGAQVGLSYNFSSLKNLFK